MKTAANVKPQIETGGAATEALTWILFAAFGVSLFWFGSCIDTARTERAAREKLARSALLAQLDCARPDERRRVMASLWGRELFGRLKCPTLYVRSGFFDLDYDDKEAYASVYYGHCLCSVDEYHEMEIRDVRTDRRVATMNAYGLQWD